VLKMTETVQKNSLIFSKYVWIIHLNFIVIAISLSEKKMVTFFNIAPHDRKLMLQRCFLYSAFNTSLLLGYNRQTNHSPYWHS
jgi:hypothetical protein